MNPAIDPTFSFMTVDHDGKIRMDCSSPYAMARLVGTEGPISASPSPTIRTRTGTASSRPSAGLMNPNHYLAVAIRYLLTHRPQWPAQRAVGKTLVSSSMIDRVVQEARPPAAAKCRSASSGSCRACSTARAVSAARRAPAPASCGATARSGRPTRTARSWTCWRPRSPPAPARIPGEHYRELTAEFGTPYYTRIDAPATPEQKAKLQKLSPEAVKESKLAGEPITAKLTRAPGNNAPIGGLKVVAANGWFAARPSGTENIYKIYAESFTSKSHLNAIVSEAQAMVNNALGSGTRP